MHPCPRKQRADIVSLLLPSCEIREHGWRRRLFGSVGGHIAGNSWVWCVSGLMSYPHGERGLPLDQHLWFSFLPSVSFWCSQCDVSIWLPGYFPHHDCSCHICTNSTSCKGIEADAVVCARPWSQKGALSLSNLTSNIMSQLSLGNVWRRSVQNVF